MMEGKGGGERKKRVGVRRVERRSRKTRGGDEEGDKRRGTESWVRREEGDEGGGDEEGV